MKHNPTEVAALYPDYLGFIFYKGSPRNYKGDIPLLPKSIKKVGVFVNATHIEIKERVAQLQLDVIQLHGEESADFCKKLALNRKTTTAIWKVFSIKDTFDFSVLKNYEPYVSAFLFDTKGKAKGGNGYTFNWKILEEYPSSTPIVLSGGIGLDELDQLSEILKTDLPIVAVDVNSKFEDQPGLKNTNKLQLFMEKLNTLQSNV
ncbi:phosphoribosylanthranilate isomerase [Marixanthomonas spongiae]|uniref:N-(5'-phosphoribosyl)anthranilate isomerase n=1 Tax=Marixanthomonas spongiae TaxID=2174845 RepID=A0A2U0I8I6_9FLAO|nr:phosphoribosylanthranilate isomerase [Marixanthomonas spongiae]PVW17423.1 N-(5'-phosphoribosyl)anthranilate isomerase [Marixanthomonas spongiae]